MSEFLAEAQVLITPDTTKFRTLLAAELAVATRGLPPVAIPVAPVVAAGGLGALTAQAAGASVALDRVNRAQKTGAVSTISAAKAAAIHTKSLGQLERGALASSLSLFGVRGATLAASSSFLAGAAAVTLFARSVGAAAGLETELNVFRVTAGATADEMERVSAQAIALGADITLPGVSSRDAAEAMSGLARAGLEVEESLAGARGVLQLATAAQISNAEATELAASALNAFGLAGDEAVHVADLLTNAANEAQGSISDMGLALRQSAAIASLVGVSLEDNVALLTILARAGLRSSDAGTSLRVAFQRLINPTKEAAAIFERFNIQLRDTQGNIRPEVFAEFQQALEGLTRARQQETLATVFGADASRAAAILGQQGIQVLDETRAALDRAGAAAELAGARTSGFAGAMEAVKNAVSTLGTSVGGFATGPLTGLANTMARVVVQTDSAVESFKRLRNALPGEGGDDGGGFFSGLTDSLPEQLDQFTSLVEVISRGETLRFGEGPIEALNRLNAEAKTATALIGDVRQETRNLFAEFDKAGGGPTALNQLALGLDEMADKLATGDLKAQGVSQRIREIIREVQGLEGLPPSTIDIQAHFDPVQITQETDATSARIIENLQRLGGPMAELGIDLITSLGDGMKSAVPAVAAETGQILVQSLGTQLSVAEATGAGDSELLRILREREQKEAAFLEKILARPQDAKTQALVRDAARNLGNTRRQIQGILDTQAADAKAATANAVRAQSEADQAFLDSLGGREGRLQSQVLIAAATKAFKDDIRANTALRNFYKNAIVEAKKTIRDARLRANTVAALVADQIRASIGIRTAQRALAEALAQEEQDRKDAAAKRRQNRTEGLELNLEIAQTNENEAAQRQALNALLADINKQIAATEKGTNAWRRLRLKRAQYRKELEELNAEEKKTGTSLEALAFDFFQKQQGFAANLLGNLIPSSATAGLVGGSQPTPDPGAQLQAQAAFKTASPTYGQAATEVSLLDQIHNVLKDIRAGRSHPEAAYQRAAGSAALDVM